MVNVFTMIEEWKEAMIEETTVRKLTTCGYYLCKVIPYKFQLFDMHYLGSLLWEFQGMENNLKIRKCRWITLILSVSLHNDFQHESHQLPTQVQITHDKTNNSCSDCSNTAGTTALQIHSNAANCTAVLLVQSETQKFLDNCYKTQITSYMDMIYFYSSKYIPP